MREKFYSLKRIIALSLIIQMLFVFVQVLPNSIARAEAAYSLDFLNWNDYVSKLLGKNETKLDALVLFDKTGPYGWLGELYGIASQNLASHFGKVSIKTIDGYKTGEIKKYKCVIYVGSTYDEPIPSQFLDDVLNESITKVIWMNNNIWQLVNRSKDFQGKYGFKPHVFDASAVGIVNYKGVDLTRSQLNKAGIMSYSGTIDEKKAKVLAKAVKADGTTIPWAIRSLNLTYIGEIPFTYINETDRYLIFCDLLFDALNPTAPTRHRALVRLEDISPNSDPAQLRAIVDYLYSQKVPFSMALIPLYKAPNTIDNDGKPLKISWSERPQMLAEVKYALKCGGSIVMHGYTHQLDGEINPYSGITGDDFEFFSSHVDLNNNVIYDGPVKQDSTFWALNRVSQGLIELSKVGLPRPSVFEFPHYAGSPTDARAIQTIFKKAYHRGLYFSGGTKLFPENTKNMIGQFFPYVVKDIYGWEVIPENLGNYEPEAFNNHPARFAEDLIRNAEKNVVVRDGFASFFFHPYLPLTELKNIVEGIKAKGFAFVSINSL